MTTNLFCLCYELLLPIFEAFVSFLHKKNSFLVFSCEIADFLVNLLTPKINVLNIFGNSALAMNKMQFHGVCCRGINLLPFTRWSKRVMLFTILQPKLNCIKCKFMKKV